MEIKKERFFATAFIILGIFIASASVFLPLKYILLLIIGIAAIVFTFFQIEYSFGMFFVVMSIVPHQYWNNMLILLAAIFYFGVFLIQVANGKRKGFSFKDINIFIIIFGIFAVYSVLISSHISDSLRMCVILLSCMLFSILMLGLAKDKKSLNIIMSFICIAVFLTSLYAIYQKFTGIEVRAEFIDVTQSDGTVARVFSTMDNPNNFAEYLVLFLPLCFSHFLNVKDEYKKVIILGISLLGIVALVLTLSRSSYVAFFIGFVFYVLLVNKRLMPFCIILGIAMIPFLPDFMVNRLLTIGKDSSSSYRFLIWENVFSILKDYWVSGIGMGPEVFKNIYGIYSNNAAYKAMHSHNLMLQTLVEMGIGGFITFILLLFSSLKQSFSAYLKTNDKYLKNLLSALLFSIISITIFSFGEYVWYYPRVMLSFWIVLGLSFSTVKLAKNENKA